MPDLITTARAKNNLAAQSSFTAAEDATIAALVSGCSKAAQAYCRREFATTTRDEVYTGRGSTRLVLKDLPIVSVARVRDTLTDVLWVANGNTGSIQQARVAVAATGLTLTRVASGVTNTDTVLFAANVTIGALAAAITALGNGWSAEAVTAYGGLPSADLFAPGGALSARPGPAALAMHVGELADFRIDADRGWLERDARWCAGQTYRVQYTSGHPSVPEDVQEAVAEWVAVLFWMTKRDPGLIQSTTSAGTLISDITRIGMPASVKALLAPHRRLAI